MVVRVRPHHDPRVRQIHGVGSWAPRPHNKGRNPLVSDEAMWRVVSMIREAPDMTLLEPLGMRYKKNVPPELPEAGGRRRSEGGMAVGPRLDRRGKHILARRDRRELQHDAPVWQGDGWREGV